MQTPLVLLVGYLGAGKTTFLQRIIPALGGLGVRPRVILNDYQDARVDAARLAALDALVTPISGDCICCGSREELLSTLLTLEAQANQVVLIEANGTSDAAELHDILVLDRRLSAYTRPVQVTVIDASRWQKRWFDKTLERDQTETASHLWLNWTEGLASTRLETVELSLKAVNALAQRITPETFASQLAALSADAATAPPRLPSGEAAVRSHDHLARHHFASIGVEFPPVVSREALKALVVSMTPQLRRAKGVVALADAPHKQFAWSYIGGDRVLRFDSLPEGGFAPVAVFIGTQLSEAELLQQVAALDINARTP